MKLELPAFSNARVLVVGDLMLDSYWHGRASRLSPEAPVPVVRVGQVENRLGGAGNAALNLAALGVQVTLMGCIGRDDAGGELRNLAEASGIETVLIDSEAVPTITKLRVFGQHQQLLRVDFETLQPRDEAVRLAEGARAQLADTDALLLSDYGKGALGVQSEVQQIITAARKAGVPVFVDPKGRDFSRYKSARLLSPNLVEFEAVVGPCDSDEQLLTRGGELARALDLDALLVTRGADGMSLVRGLDRSMKQPVIHLPARAREVSDVTGAGDTVIAVLTAACAVGCGLDQAMALANLAAGIVVGKLGTASVSVLELAAELAKDRDPERGPLSRQRLLVVVANARARGERIVFTNGCFDLLHAGHVGYLQQARALGDRLVVAVNSDVSVRRLKGEGRPVNPVQRRMAVLAGLAAVDWVVCFDEDTPENLLRELAPDVLVKGGDYVEEEIVGADIIRAGGGQVAVLDYFEDLSTTAILDKIRGD